MLRWAKVAEYQNRERPEIEGLFEDGICVGTFFQYRSIYLVNLYCYQNASIHRSFMVDTETNARRLLKLQYVKSFESDLEFHTKVGNISDKEVALSMD